MPLPIHQKEIDMKKETRDKWLAALRSGQYGKTKRKLTDGEGNYCCLGVLCEITEGVTFERCLSDIGRHPHLRYVYKGFTDRYYLPGTLENDLGITHSETLQLSHLNDVSETFEPVIEAIERMFPDEESD